MKYYYSNSAEYRRERKCIMTSKKLTVRYGLLTVLLVSLSLASTSNAWTIYEPEVAVAKPKWCAVPDWRGGLKVYLWCDGTPGATIRYEWAPGRYWQAPDPTACSPLYWCPLLVTCEGQLRVKGFKPGYWPSEPLIIIFRYR